MRLNVYWVDLQFKGCKGEWFLFQHIQVYAHTTEEAVCERMTDSRIVEVLKKHYLRLVNWEVV